MSIKLKLKVGKSFTISDGSVFSDRKVALEHEKSCVRLRNLKAAMAGFNSETLLTDDNADLHLMPEDIPQFIVDNAELIMTALTVKEGRGPRGPRAASQTGLVNKSA